MVVSSKVKAYLKSKGMRTSKELLEALDSKLETMLEAAIMKALLDKRKTVQPDDLGSGEV